MSSPIDLSKLRLDRDTPAPGVRRALGRNLVIAGIAVGLVAAVIVYFRRGSVPTVQVVTAAATSSPTGAVSGSTGVTAHGAVVALADAAMLEVELDVNQASIARVRANQPARITLDAYPDTVFRGTVRQVAAADPGQATVRVNVAILDRDSRVLPGMAARADFIEPDTGNIRGQFVQPRIRVPADAVKLQDGKSMVWLVRDGKLEARTVDAGPVNGGFREVRTGLSGGELLMISGVQEPKDGMRVRTAKGS